MRLPRELSVLTCQCRAAAFASPQVHGGLMMADLENINRVRAKLDPHNRLRPKTGIDRGCGKTSLWPSVFLGVAALTGSVETG
jgi:hypothetical protein